MIMNEKWDTGFTDESTFFLRIQFLYAKIVVEYMDIS